MICLPLRIIFGNYFLTVSNKVEVHLQLFLNHSSIYKEIQHQISSYKQFNNLNTKLSFSWWKAFIIYVQCMICLSCLITTDFNYNNPTLSSQNAVFYKFYLYQKTLKNILKVFFFIMLLQKKTILLYFMDLFSSNDFLRDQCHQLVLRLLFYRKLK